MKEIELLKRLFRAAVAAVAAERCVPPALPAPPRGRTLVVGAGKAAAAMARAVEAHWRGPLSGTVVTRYGHTVPTARIEVIEAGHPLPDLAGMSAAVRILENARGLGPDDLMLALFSGGGSSLLTLPAPGVSLEDKRRIGKALLESGATIAEINCVRRHLSAIKGGRLAAAAYPARVTTLMVSDVPDDVLHDIASGPTVEDPTSLADAVAVLDRQRIPVTDAVRRALADPALETAKPGDPRLAEARPKLIARPQDALTAAAALAEAAGIHRVVLGDALQGEAREVGRAMAGIARSCARHGEPAEPPCVLLSGGETTVSMTGIGGGRGGRNLEFLLGLGIGLAGAPGIFALAADTDGIDGSETNAGAVLRPDSLQRAGTLGLDPWQSLLTHDSYGYFAALGDLLVTGPTLTNVNDFRAVLIAERDGGGARGGRRG